MNIVKIQKFRRVMIDEVSIIKMSKLIIEMTISIYRLKQYKSLYFDVWRYYFVSFRSGFA